MDFLLSLILDTTKTYIGLGALLVIMAVCLVWFTIVENIQKKKSCDVSSNNNDAEQAAPVFDNASANITAATAVAPVAEQVHVREAITVDEARVEMSDEVATHLIVETEHLVRVAKTGKKAIVNIDTISANFADGDIVDLQALQDKKLVSRKDVAVKVLARGSLNKRLVVVADAFSADAVKMIVLMDGEARHA